MSTDQFFDANGILRDAGVGEEISRYMRDIQGPLNIGQDANSLKAIREEMKVWQSLDATKEIRDAMKSMQARRSDERDPRSDEEYAACGSD